MWYTLKQSTLTAINKMNSKFCLTTHGIAIYFIKRKTATISAFLIMTFAANISYSPALSFEKEIVIDHCWKNPHQHMQEIAP